MSVIEIGRPVKVFYSYSHVDESLRDQLNIHMSLLQRTGVISSWYDRNINAGEVIDKEIKEHLESADLILLLVSPNFIHSDYCYGVEMTRAIERHASGSARVVPIILRPVDWHTSPFGKLLALPTDGKPITTWQNIDSAFLDVTEGIRKICLSRQLTATAKHMQEQENAENRLSVGVSQPIESGKDKSISVDLLFLKELNLTSFSGRKLIYKLKFTPDGQSLIGSVGQDWIVIWDIESGRIRHERAPKQSERYAHLGTFWYTRSVSISPDGKFLASTMHDHAIQVWELAGLRPSQVLGTFDRPAQSVAFTSDGQWLLAGLMTDGIIQSWSRKDRFRSVDHHKAHDDSIEAIAIHPTKLDFASCSVDGTVKYWSIVDEQIKEIHLYEGNDGEHVVDVKFSPEGKFLVSGSVSGQICLWETNTGRLVQKWKHEQVVRELAFSPDGEILISASNDHTLTLWNVNSGDRLASKRFAGAVGTTAISPDGTIIASAVEGEDKAQLWGVLRATVSERKPVSYVVYTNNEHENVLKTSENYSLTRLVHLREQRQMLFEAYKEYNEYLIKHPTSASKDDAWHSRIIRGAIIACRLYPDKGRPECTKCLKTQANKRGFKSCAKLCQNTLAYIAELRLTPNCVDQSTPGAQQHAEVRYWGWYGERNINALKDALDRIDELIDIAGNPFPEA